MKQCKFRADRHGELDENEFITENDDASRGWSRKTGLPLDPNVARLLNLIFIKASPQMMLKNTDR